MRHTRDPPLPPPPKGIAITRRRTLKPLYRPEAVFLAKALGIITERLLAKGWPPEPVAKPGLPPIPAAHAQARQELLRALRDGGLVAEADLVRGDARFEGAR